MNLYRLKNARRIFNIGTITILSTITILFTPKGSMCSGYMRLFSRLFKGVKLNDFTDSLLTFLLPALIIIDFKSNDRN